MECDGASTTRPMSSMIEGSEDGAREDEPQFENNGHGQFPVTPGWEANNEGKREQHEIETGRDSFPDEPLSATNSRDPALRESDSALHSESGEVLSVHNREVNKGIGSGDDFGSIPDDTPSVQVSCSRPSRALLSPCCLLTFIGFNFVIEK